MISSVEELYRGIEEYVFMQETEQDKGYALQELFDYLKDVELEMEHNIKVEENFEISKEGLWICNECGNTFEDEVEAYEHLLEEAK